MDNKEKKSFLAFCLNHAKKRLVFFEKKETNEYHRKMIFMYNQEIQELKIKLSKLKP